MGTPSDDQGNAICSDDSGNLYHTGVVSSSIYVSKYDSFGNLVWIEYFNGTLNESAFAIGADNSGNVIVTGYFMGSIDFDSGPGVTLVTSAGSRDIFILKLNFSGNLVWVKSLGGTGWDYASDIHVEASGDIFVTGGFQDTVDFDPGTGVYQMQTPLSGDGVFILSLNSNGDFLWVKALYGSSTVRAQQIIKDLSGNILVCGFFLFNVDFDPGPGTYYLNSTPHGDAFVVKLNSLGDLVWVRNFGGPQYEDCYSIAVDLSGNVYGTGLFVDTTDFDPGVGVANLYSNGDSDVFIFKLDAGGNYIWAKSIGGISGDFGNDIQVDICGNVILTGGFKSAVDFDPGTGSFIMTAAGMIDIYLLRINDTGNFITAKGMGGPYDDFVAAISTRNCDLVYVVGAFRETADFDPPIGYLLTSIGNSDVFLGRYGYCSHFETSNDSACDSMLSPGGTQIWNTSGIYVDSLTNVNGCDSILVIDLTISPTPIMNLTVSGSTVFCQGDSVTLSAPGSLAGYQWYRKNYLLPGEVNQHYVAKSAGKYKCVGYNLLNCSDTSGFITVEVPCIPVDPNQQKEDLTEEESNSEILVYPNPGYGIINLQSSNGNLFVYSADGRLIYYAEITGGGHTLDISSFGNGVYQFILNSEERIYRKKVQILN